MTETLTIPTLDESDDSAMGTVVSIPVEVGDKVAVEDTVLEIETDKTTIEIPSPYAGKVEKIYVQVGQDVSAGMKVAEFALLASKSPTPATPEKSEQPESSTAESKQTVTEPPTPPEPKVVEQASHGDGSMIPAGPSVRRLARKLGVDLRALSGLNRITVDDVESYVKKTLAQLQGDGEKNSVKGEQTKLTSSDQFGPIHSEPASQMTLATSRNMTHAWSSIPHAWIQQSIDITDLELWRKQHKENGGSLTITVIVAKAIAAALKEFPRLNSSYDEENKQIHYKDYFDIGIAVDTPHGLVVPALRSVDTRGLEHLASDLRELSQKAHQRKLTPKEMRGAGITLSNLGAIGLDAIFPTVHWPQAAIVGMASSELVPKYVDSELLPRRIMNLTLGFDHRIINGAEGARFLVYVKKLLEDIRLLVI